MVRILHTSDVQLDAPFGFLGEKGAHHRQQLRETFGKIVDLASDDGYHLLLIAGDLFNDNRTGRDTVNFVIRKLGELSIPVCILPGNHDCYDDKSIYRKYSFLPNVHILTERPAYVEFPELELVVAGNPLTSRYDNRPPLQGLNWPDDYRWRIAVAHGNLQIAGFIESEARPIYPDDIADCGADYVALGDWHSYSDYSQGDVKAFYSGAPEPTALSQSGAGSVASITLSESGVQVEGIQVGSTRVKSLSLDVSGLDETEVINRILAEADSSLMLSVSLTGLKDIDQLMDLETIQQAAAGEFYWLQVTDQSHTALDSIDAAEFPETHVIGQYVRMMQEKVVSAGEGEEKYIAEQALQLGVALLQGREVFR
jgi:exonuclease SbcD